MALNPAFPRTDSTCQSSVQVDATGRAQITDFCLATVATDVGPEPDTPRLRNHTTQWTAPEVLDGGKHTKAADIFSLGMVVIEVCHRLVSRA